MLVLKREHGEVIKIFESADCEKPIIQVKVLKIDNEIVSIGFDAAKKYIIRRDELHERVLNRKNRINTHQKDLDDGAWNK